MRLKTFRLLLLFLFELAFSVGGDAHFCLDVVVCRPICQPISHGVYPDLFCHDVIARHVVAICRVLHGRSAPKCCQQHQANDFGTFDDGRRSLFHGRHHAPLERRNLRQRTFLTELVRKRSRSNVAKEKSLFYQRGGPISNLVGTRNLAPKFSLP